MFRNLFRAIFTVVGGIAGYGIAILLRYIIIQTNIVSAKDWTNLQEVALASACVIIFTVLFFLLAPLLNRKSKKVTDNIESDLKSVSTNEILGGTAGLVIGLFIAFLISNVYNYIRIPYLPLALTVVTYFVLGYLGVVIATRKGRDIVNMIARESRSVGGSGPRSLFAHQVPGSASDSAVFPPNQRSFHNQRCCQSASAPGR